MHQNYILMVRKSEQIANYRLHIHEICNFIHIAYLVLEQEQISNF